MTEPIHSNDPSELTTQMVWREVQHLKELMETRVGAVETSIKVAHEDLVRVPTDVQKQVGNLRELHDERFRSIDQRFVAGDLAVDAALAAQKELAAQQTQAFKEATEKSDRQFAEQIGAQSELLRTEVKGLVAQIDETKDRVSRSESKGEGVKENKNDNRWLITAVMVAASLLLGYLAHLAGK